MKPIGKRILVVDDDLLVRQSVKKILDREGYDAVLVENADEGLEKAGSEVFDLILSDIRMPDKNGVEAAKELRRLFREKAKKDIPIIFITGYAEASVELKAENLGEVILKPFDVDRLLMTIREYL
jgi:CheY-like chemotaxis protein